MKTRCKIVLIFNFLLLTSILFSQNERLIIGRTTGKLKLGKGIEVRTFGFADTLSGQITFPGSSIDTKAGDEVNINFWNISQGNPVSVYCKEIEFQQRDKGSVLMKIKEPVHHMEHGFYSFTAQNPGTYFYYSPENYPFNLQAGMFGVIVIRPKENDAVKKLKEIIWCSNELDTQWHTDTIMGTEYDVSNKPVILPPYKPNYFLINGIKASEIKGLQAENQKDEVLLLRLVNAGLYEHEIVFPPDVKPELIFGNKDNIKATPKGNQLQLHAGECMELRVSFGTAAVKQKITYRFIDPVVNKVRYKAHIPVFY